MFIRYILYRVDITNEFVDITWKIHLRYFGGTHVLSHTKAVSCIYLRKVCLIFVVKWKFGSVYWRELSCNSTNSNFWNVEIHLWRKWLLQMISNRLLSSLERLYMLEELALVLMKVLILPFDELHSLFAFVKTVVSRASITHCSFYFILKCLDLFS